MKQFVLFIVLTLGFGLVKAQDLVVKVPQKRAVVLEEFTGINCVFCPDGHRIAKEIKTNNPGRVNLINVHAGFYANPSSGQPDFRTPGGSELDGFVGVSGYPSGTVNRSYVDGELDYSRTLWAGTSDFELDQISPVNVAAKTSFDASSRMLTVEVEVFYPIDGVNSSNNLIIALTQDNVEGPQTGASNFNPGDILPNGNYNHGHMLRAFIEGPFGREISPTSAGSLIKETFTYELPSDIRTIPLVADDCKLVVYVANSQTDIQTGITLGLNDENDGSGEPVELVAGNMNSNIVNASGTTSADFSSTIYPFAGTMAMYDFSVRTIDAPQGWEWSYTIDANSYTSDESISLENGLAQQFDFNVEPNSPGVGRYRVEIQPIGSNDAVQRYDLVVVNDCEELIVYSNQIVGQSSLPASTFTQNYLNAFDSKSVDKKGVLEIQELSDLIDAENMEGINNVYYSASWTGNPLDETTARVFLTYTGNGGKLLIAGTGVANSIFNQGGSTISRNLLQSRFGIRQSVQGNASNKDISTNEDGLFADFSDFELQNIYSANGGSINPDILTLTSSATANLNYADGGIAGAQKETESTGMKTVFLPYSLEMIEGEDNQAKVLEAVYNYFYGISSGNEIEPLTGVNVFPNLITKGQMINVSTENGLTPLLLTLIDQDGRTIDQKVFEGSNQYTLNYNQQNSGIYFVKLEQNGKSTTRKLIVR